ncbi:MAG: GIY-YIG nuclease family protein [Candidatus Cyclobacteriaceae bacterium M2_1C_046]
MSRFYVYIVTNLRHTVFYTGFTDDVERRTYEHKNQLRESFTKKYNCSKLIYFEEFTDSEEALHREKQIKRYRRQWKRNLINDINPNWMDLYDKFISY